MEGNRSRGRGAVRNGLLTGVSTAVVSGSAAVLGVILSRKFGHGVKTDGFFAAYGIYLALVLVASTLRVVALPRFALARSRDRLPHEVGTWAVALAAPLGIVFALAVAWPHGVASALSSNAHARSEAAKLLPWVVGSAVAQIYGGLTASALAADDDYDWAAYGFACGSLVGVAVTVLFIGHGVIAFGWGLAANGVLSLVIPLVPLLLHRAVAWPDARTWARLFELTEAVSIPVALQGLYVIGLRFATGLGPGRATTFSYAYLIAAFFVAVTASSVALVATVPFVRSGVAPDRVARHVVAVSWVSLTVVAAAAGVFALAGQGVVRRLLGSSYGGNTGAELGRLVVYLAPWMVASVASTITYPLLFARGRARWLPLVAGGALILNVLIEWGARAAFGLGGLAGGLAVTTVLVLVAMLAALGAVQRVLRGIVEAALICGLLAFAAFGLPRLVVGPFEAAPIGLLLYCTAMIAVRPHGLRQAWAYLRELQ